MELLRQGVHDRVLCSYHLTCCQLSVNVVVSNVVVKPASKIPGNILKSKKNAITYIFRRMNTLFFSTVFSAVFIALRDLSLLMRFSALRIEDMQCEICFILGYEHGFTCFLYSCLRESKSLQHLCLHLPEPTMALNYEQLISKWGIQCHR